MENKIIILDGEITNPSKKSWNKFQRLGEVIVYDRTSPEEVRERIKDATHVFSNKVLLTKDLINSSPNLKWIGVLATGFNTVDTSAAASKGIPVTNIPAYSTESVVQHTFAFILNHCNSVAKYNNSVTNGQWETAKDFSFTDFPLQELDGKTIGLIGFGTIGSRVAQVASAFGMKILAFTQNPDKYKKTPNVKFVDLNILLKKSDFISLHCLLSPETQGIINKEALSRMKKTAFIVNTGRGPLINEFDLANALNDGVIAGAGLDVLGQEPPRFGSPLIGAKNCSITPHVAWSSNDARERLVNVAYENLRSFIEDGIAKNCINM